MTSTTTNALNGLLYIRDGNLTARWNFPDAVGSSIKSPAGIGYATTISYSFLTSVPPYSWIGNFQAFSPAQVQAGQLALIAIEDITNINFIETTDVGQMTFGNSGQPSGQGGYATPPNYSYYEDESNIDTVFDQSESGDIWINRYVSWGADGWKRGQDGYATLLHEIGHALGLKHPFEASSNGYLLDASIDNESHTVMSYTTAPHSTIIEVTESQTGHSSREYTLCPSTLMPLDIEALQYLYGTNIATRKGNDSYRWAVNPEILETIWDGGGTDTIDCSNQTLRCVINLQAGAYSSISLRQTDEEKHLGLELPNWFRQTLPSDIYDGSNNLAIAKGVVIEDAKGGSASDKLLGNDVGNSLTGGSGNDSLFGYGGNDTLNGGGDNDVMLGGKGDDIYHVQNTGDVVTEKSSEGSDLVCSSISSYTLGANVENGRIVIATGSNLTGNEHANILYAGAGNNTLDGGAGTDTASYQYGLVSGATAGVNVSLAITIPQNTGRSGTDKLVNIENLTGSSLNDTLTGGAGQNTLDGGLGNDSLSGGDGNDTLIGGAGKDTLVGGKGNDVFDFNALPEMGTTSASWDVVSGFVRGQDRIDLSTLDANSATTINDAFNGKLIAATAKFSAAGQLKLVSGVLYGNTDADADAEFAIQLAGITALSASDFML